MKVEVWSDFVCPFCYMGKRNLETALEQAPELDDVTIEYKSYQLDPNSEIAPGKSMHEALAEKFNTTIDEARQMNAQIAAQAKEVGLNYDMDGMQPANTLDAHRLAKYAEKHGKGPEMAERLLSAYFTEAELISDHNTLARLAAEVGLDPEEVLTMLKSDKFTSKVHADQLTAREIGVQGVPFFVFNEKYALSGVQPADVFQEVINTVMEEEKKSLS
ncbi:Protein disulfide-isomerase [Lentibacillus sp. JNUCC-1]|uniref:DsbA family oxidoreductase n=1 Tax=Lentibacillus sp. JNUCC-1 TaxID=2654513 RepID=UPI0013205DCC|nr:DsbA family oxidoreductase [Lentibacillus sp. JNUCC-1]MUV38432.1 Protein disulfide-isomerase [Lentibacillus sp. JNUCC-1]